MHNRIPRYFSSLVVRCNEAQDIFTLHEIFLNWRKLEYSIYTTQYENMIPPDVTISIVNNIYLTLIMVQGHKLVTVNATGCGFDPHSRK